MSDDDTLNPAMRPAHKLGGGPFRAIVTDNQDPDGLRRVKLRVPALDDLETDWAFPLTEGGGAPNRGFHIVPAKDAKCVVWFEMGDYLEGVCFYKPAQWGKPEGKDAEVPKAVRDAGADAEQVHVLQVGLVQIVIDEREGQRSVRISDEQDPPTSIEWDLENRGISIDAVSAVLIAAKGGIHLKAPNVTINGRRVKTGSEPL